MKGRPWLKKDVLFLRVNYHRKSATEIAKILNRPLKTVTNKAEREGLNSKSRNQRLIKEAQLEEFIRKGETKISTLVRLTDLSRYFIKAKIEQIKSESSIIQYFETEEDIFKALQPKYKADDLQAWEKSQLKQPTPKGYECPKLNTKQLNTYR